MYPSPDWPLSLTRRVQLHSRSKSFAFVPNFAYEAMWATRDVFYAVVVLDSQRKQEREDKLD